MHWPDLLLLTIQADFPPDVSRGLDLPASSITYQDITGISPPVRLFTESVLVHEPQHPTRA